MKERSDLVVNCIFTIFYHAIDSGLLFPLVGFGIVASAWRLAYYLLVGVKFNNE